MKGLIVRRTRRGDSAVTVEYTLPPDTIDGSLPPTGPSTAPWITGPLDHLQIMAYINRNRARWEALSPPWPGPLLATVYVWVCMGSSREGPPARRWISPGAVTGGEEERLAAAAEMWLGRRAYSHLHMARHAVWNLRNVVLSRDESRVIATLGSERYRIDPVAAMELALPCCNVQSTVTADRRLPLTARVCSRSHSWVLGVRVWQSRAAHARTSKHIAALWRVDLAGLRAALAGLKVLDGER